MKRVLLAQCKRFGRYLPGAILALGLMLAGLFVLFSQVTGQAEDRPLRIGVVGTGEDTFLEMGMTLLQTQDASRFTLEFVECTEDRAKTALSAGQLDAYLVIPQGFAQDALKGVIHPLEFVSTANGADLASFLKEEITRVISRLLLESQRGVYGLESAMDAQGLSGQGKHMTTLALRYTDCLLVRDKVYTVTTLGVGDGLELWAYLLLGLSVLLSYLACLPFAPALLRRDLGSERMLSGRGRPAGLICLCELLCLWLGVTLSLGVILAIVLPLLGWSSGAAVFVGLLPVLFVAAAFTYTLCALVSHPVGGLVLSFFLGLGLCFLCGCLYPVYFFPRWVQDLAALLPPGLARALLAGQTHALLPLLAYGAAFAAVGVWLKCRRIREARL